MKRFRTIATLFFAAIVLSGTVTLAHASLILDATGTSLGFTLTTFVSGYSATYGPLSQGILPDGNVITGSSLNNKIYIFADADGQTLSTALSAISYTNQTGNPQYSLATVNGQVYGAQVAGGVFGQFSNSGAFTPIPNLSAAGVTAYYGMWADVANNDLIASTSKGLAEINPLTGTFRIINASLFPDGVSVSADGSTAYVANGGTVQAYSIATGALIATYSVGHSPDGTGVISGGTLSGDVIINNNDGTVGLLDPTKSSSDPTAYQIIATGGTRGDFVSADTSNGTLFLSQQEQVARLSCGNGCSIGAPPPPPGTPEPGTVFLLGGGFCFFALWRLRFARSSVARVTQI